MNIPFTELNVGFANAENYQRRENKELLAKYFVRDDFLERILNPNVFFLVGEKGTGKTAYATFLENNNYKNYVASIFNVRQTEYQKFLELKKLGHLPLSQYSDIWRTLLLIAVTTTIISKSGTPAFFKRFTKLGQLKGVIDDFYENAFAPEIIKLLNFVESGEVATSLIASHTGLKGGVSSKSKVERSDSSAVFQTNLLKIRKAFEEALSTVKLDENLVVFLDGIDIRPEDIDYQDYFECVRGLTEAVWSINNDFFSNIKDADKRIRVVLLVRPDIFLRTSLQNINTKLRDNSVFLDWSTTYKDYRSALLFKVADQLLAAQQSNAPKAVGDAWDHYFPFYAENVKSPAVSAESGINSFLAFLRISYYRPRDINTMVGTIQENIKRKRGSASYVLAEDFDDPSYRDAHAEYLLGEIRDQLLFYYSQDEFDLFLQFFSHLRGKRRFTYDQYHDAFVEFITECDNAGRQLPQFFESADIFLQFLYEQNVICYIERDDSGEPNSEVFIRWCFRERTLARMSPKVRQGVEYEIFYGLSKALNIGRRVSVRKRRTKKQVGTVVKLDIKKGFGFVRGGPEHIDYYFKVTDFKGHPGQYPWVGQKVSFDIQDKNKKSRAGSLTPSK